MSANNGVGGLVMQPADVLDRLSILILHKFRGDERRTREELGAMANEANRLNPVLGRFLCLLFVNAEIWTLEAEIRNGSKMPIKEVGRRALAIRDKNKDRVKIKNEIKELLGGYVHVKSNHASA